MRTIYFDYNATTPLDSEVRQAMLPFLEEFWGNPSSIHHVGRRVRVLLDEARSRTSEVFKCKPSEVIFTSGGTESSNLAILGTARKLRPKGRHLVTSLIEHHAVLHAFEYLRQNEQCEVTFIQPEPSGIVSPEKLTAALRPDTVLVSVMAANNEIGTVQPVAELGKICQNRGIIFHTDAVQWFGKEPFDSIHQFNADLVSFCAHKLHGPKGAGALFIRSPLQPHPILFGGGHENERRPGTENVVSIMGLVKTVELFTKNPVFPAERLRKLTRQLAESVLSISGTSLLGSQNSKLANTLGFLVAGSDAITIIAGLDLEGVCASSGAACSAGSLEPSHVVTALGYSRELSHSLIRFSLGRETTLSEVQFVERMLPEVIERTRKGSRSKST